LGCPGLAQSLLSFLPLDFLACCFILIVHVDYAPPPLLTSYRLCWCEKKHYPLNRGETVLSCLTLLLEK
jgi:hypothetical protein